MGLLLLSARLILSGLFAVAGVAKLTNLKVSQKTVADFGLPGWLANGLGSVLPFAELAVAISLLPARSAWWGGWGALVLLLAFITAIATNLAQGRKPDCQCFGQIQSKPIGWPTLARNGVLASFAGLVVLAGAAVQPRFIDTVAGLSERQALALAIAVFALVPIAGESWLVFHLFKQHGRLLLRMDELEKRLGADPMHGQPPASEGLPLGAPAPAFELPTLAGQPLALQGLLDSKPTVLIFADPDCGPCKDLLPEIARWQQDYARNVRIAVVSRGTEKANRAKSKRYGVQDVLLQKDREVAELYQVSGVPAAVLIRADGAIGSHVVGGSDAVASLVMNAGARVAEGSDPREVALPNPLTSSKGLPIGTMAPSLMLRDLSGRMVSLSEFRGRTTVVLFWNPDCGFCQRMLPALQIWEENRSNGTPALIVVSTGAVETNEELGLRSQVLLDDDLNAARKFRGGGTPSAVLIDANGKIASELGVGIPNVLALLGIANAKKMSPIARTQWPVRLTASSRTQGQLQA